MEEERKYKTHWVWPFLVAVLLIALGVSMAMGIRAQIKLEKAEQVAIEYHELTTNLRTYLRYGYVPGFYFKDDLDAFRDEALETDKMFSDVFGYTP